MGGLDCPAGHQARAGKHHHSLTEMIHLAPASPVQVFILSRHLRMAPLRQALLFRPCPLSSPVVHRPLIELCIPSSLDPTLAPPGCHVVSLFTQYTPYTLAGGKAWDEQQRNAYADRGKES